MKCLYFANVSAPVLRSTYFSIFKLLRKYTNLTQNSLSIAGGGRRTTTQSSANATRDSQLLSLLAARRRQLLNERLATHINTLASLAHKANKYVFSLGEGTVKWVSLVCIRIRVEWLID